MVRALGLSRPAVEGARPLGSVSRRTPGQGWQALAGGGGGGGGALIADTFERVDGSLGTSDSGHTWETIAGTAAIVSGAARLTAGSPSWHLIGPGQELHGDNYAVEATLIVGATNCRAGIVGRSYDDLTVNPKVAGYSLRLPGGTDIERIIPTSATGISGIFDEATAIGDEIKLRVEFEDDEMRLYVVHKAQDDIADGIPSHTVDLSSTFCSVANTAGENARPGFYTRFNGTDTDFLDFAVKAL